MIDYVLLLQSFLVLVLDLEDWLTILDADLCDDRNCSEDFAMARQVMVCVCVFWPPVKDELLLSMRFQSLVLTSMTSPPYPRPQ